LFSNSILAATYEDLHFSGEDESHVIALGGLGLPNKPCYLEIIDGQHRLFAYPSLHDLMDHTLCVIVISNLDAVERAKLFVDVNREQTKSLPLYCGTCTL